MSIWQCLSMFVTKKFLHMFNTAFLLFFCFSLVVLQLKTIVLLIAAIFTPSHPLSKRKLFCFVLVTCSRKVTLLCTSFHFLHITQNSQNKQTKILTLETTIFGLKMMVKSGLEFFILKSYVPLQSCYCPVQKNLPRTAELAWQVNRYL